MSESKVEEKLSELTMRCKIVVKVKGEFSASTFGKILEILGVEDSLKVGLGLKEGESVEVSECYGVAVNR